MNILVADGDRRFLEILRGVIEREGHTVIVADDPDRALALLAPGQHHLLVVDAGLRDQGAERLVRQVQGRRVGRPPAVVLMASVDEGERRRVQTLVAECDVRRVLRRPFPMFDLVDLVHDLAQELSGETVDDQPSVGSYTDEVPRPGSDPSEGTLGVLSQVTLPAATAYLGLPLSRANLHRISRLWARRGSGVLRLDAGPGQAQGWMLLGEGGPLDSAGWELVSAALHGGRLEFEPRTVPGAGDHLGLGAMIFGRARDPQQQGFLRQISFQALLRVRASAPLSALPLCPETRRLLDQADPGLPLGELASRLALDPASVGPDLHAIDLMGLIELGEPLPAHRQTSPDSGARAHRPGDGRPPTPRAVGPGGGTHPHRPRPPAPGPAAPPARDAAADPADDPADDLAGDALSQPTDIRPGGLRARRALGQEDWPRVRRRLAERSRSWATRQAAQQGDEAREQNVTRLRKELERLLDQPAAVVLGLPAGAEPELVHAVTLRLRERYQSMAQDPALPGEGQRLAQEMIAAIDRASMQMLSGGGGGGFGVAVEGLTEEERLLQAARIRVGQQRWPEALRLLRRARDLRLDQAEVLSLLGVATMHDPDLEHADRVEEAQGLLMLAVQFEPDNGICNLNLARFLLEHGEPGDAVGPARRAVAALPGDAAAAAVLARALAQVPPPGR